MGTGKKKFNFVSLHGVIASEYTLFYWFDMQATTRDCYLNHILLLTKLDCFPHTFSSQHIFNRYLLSFYFGFGWNHMNVFTIYKISIWKTNEKGPPNQRQHKNPRIHNKNKTLDLGVKVSNLESSCIIVGVWMILRWSRKKIRPQEAVPHSKLYWKTYG